MRLHTDKYYDNLSAKEVEERLSFLGELDDNMNVDDMKMTLKDFERSRHIQIWHDASTIANHSHILFAINILYDAAVFYTNAEYKNKFGHMVYLYEYSNNTWCICMSIVITHMVYLYEYSNNTYGVFV